MSRAAEVQKDACLMSENLCCPGFKVIPPPAVRKSDWAGRRNVNCSVSYAASFGCAEFPFSKLYWLGQIETIGDAEVYSKVH